MRKSEKCYMIIDKNNKHLYGAFNLTKEGKAKAEAYLSKINQNKNLKIIIK